MATDFDVIVIGAGPGGYVAAIRSAQLGFKTAIVERAELGGICLNWGCIPTKALLKSGELYEKLDHLDEYGLAIQGRSYDFTKIIERSRGIAKQLSGGIAFLMKKNKIEVIKGAAKLEKGAPAPKVVITADGAAPRTVQAKHVILATGARARVIPGIEPDGKLIWSYREALAPDVMPKRLIVIGSGAIGSEFASFFSNMGSEVTLIEAMDRILPVEDAEVSTFVRKAFEKQKMKVITNAKVQGVRKSGDTISAIVERENLGGICLNWGCIPTKALLKSGEKFESLSHL